MINRFGEDLGVGDENVVVGNNKANRVLIWMANNVSILIVTNEAVTKDKSLEGDDLVEPFFG